MRQTSSHISQHPLWYPSWYVICWFWTFCSLPLFWGFGDFTIIMSYVPLTSFFTNEVYWSNSGFVYHSSIPSTSFQLIWDLCFEVILHASYGNENHPTYCVNKYGVIIARRKLNSSSIKGATVEIVFYHLTPSLVKLDLGSFCIAYSNISRCLIYWNVSKIPSLNVLSQ